MSVSEYADSAQFCIGVRDAFSNNLLILAGRTETMCEVPLVDIKRLQRPWRCQWYECSHPSRVISSKRIKCDYTGDIKVRTRWKWGLQTSSKFV